MANLDGITLMTAIQAVDKQIEYFENLLGSETLRDPEEIQSLIFSYEQAAEKLKEAYIAERKEGSNLPEYSSLVRE